MEYVKKTPKKNWGAFDEVILTVIEADGIWDNSEHAFNSSWSQFKRSA